VWIWWVHLKEGHQLKHTLCSLFALIKIYKAVNTGWFEIFKAISKSATSTQDLFHNTCLARYPRPQFIVFDNENAEELKREFNQI
jgi:hypothetical protein